MTKQHSILPLPLEVQKQIKSSVLITSLNQVILELVKNSLDAGARTLHIYVDPARGACTVEDDGHGIPVVEFGADGNLGKIHCTSKHRSYRKTYGSSGCFLPALSALSLLSITSRYIESSEECKVMFHGSQIIDRSYTCETQQRTILAGQGTKVEVRDLFGTMPVRVKYRVVTLENQSSADNEFDELKRRIVALLIARAWPLKVTVAGEDRKRRCVLNIRPDNDVSLGSAAGLSQTTRRPVRPDWICPLLSQAGVIDHSTAESWATASAKTTAISIRAAISLEPAPTKQVQFISFGMWPIDLHDGRLLYNEVNSLFVMSAFGAGEDDTEISEEEKLRRKSDKRFKLGEHTMRQLRGITKGVDRWPMFYIRIDITADEGMGSVVGGREVMEGSTKYLQKVLDLLRAFISRFLEEHQFQPKASIRRKHHRKHGVSSPRTSTLAEKSAFVDDAPPRPVSQAFQTWSRVKSAHQVKEDEVLYGLPRSKNGPSVPRSVSAPAPSIQPAGRKVDIGRSALVEMHSPVDLSRDAQLLLGELEHDTLSSDDSESPRVDYEVYTAAGPEGPALDRDSISTPLKSPYFRDRIVPWCNPRTGELVNINSRTGLVVTQQNEDLQVKQKTSNLKPQKTSHLPTTGPRLLPERTKSGAVKSKLQLNQDSWLGRMMSDSSLQVFRQDERPIPSIVTDNHGLDLETSCNGHNSDFCDSGIPRPLLSHRATDRSLRRLSKSGLGSAHVIAQVDQKYILATLPTSTPDTASAEGDSTLLILIDQHAASERCRVEALYEEACRPDNSTVLPEAMRFEVSSREAALFEREKMSLAGWGFHYETRDAVADGGLMNARPAPARQLVVTALASVVAERCRASPKLLIDMLRTEIWRRADDPSASRPSPPPPSSAPSDDDTAAAAPPWLSRISTIPPGLVEMLHSRACRGAVMFNDVLSVGECEALVRRVAACAFPFLCAHGRPSMVVLAGVGHGGDCGAEVARTEGERATGWMAQHTTEGYALTDHGGIGAYTAQTL